MTSLVALNPAFHRLHYVLPDVAVNHSARQQLIPVVPGEFSFVATQLPLVLTKHEHTGEFGIAALCGFAPGENLLFGGDTAIPSWQGLYVPLQLQRQPFFLGHDEQGGASICIDSQNPAVGVLGAGGVVAGVSSGVASGVVSGLSSAVVGGVVSEQHAQLPAGAERLFFDDGSATTYLAQAAELIKEIVAGEAQRRDLIALLLQLKLVQPLALDVTFGNGQSVRLQGLYSVDAQALAQLPEADVLTLHRSGFLPAVYAMVQSMSQVYHLIHLKNQQLALG